MPAAALRAAEGALLQAIDYAANSHANGRCRPLL
jgi:hypothetical protein